MRQLSKACCHLNEARQGNAQYGDYFSKWIEAQPLARITAEKAEAANRVILQAMKKKLNNAKGEWVELIPEILWSYNTTIQTTTGETPFKLVYGTKALIPIEVSIPTLQTELYHHNHNIDTRKAELDLVEEDRDITAFKEKAMKQLIERRHNKKLVPRTFSEGDLVLRRTEEARRSLSHGKLATNWKGPFRISKVLGMGAYQLQTLQGETHYQEIRISIH
ncbi:uncharacterized protein [Arachis hypogaea]|uniref:uncharacterized protein n=1 Tax=Arachis hypogaea TaxID=3818 RepID=UPI000DECC0CF|nr:uncharacterized protein LOC112748945 [Arachis hypogaea]